MKDRRGFTLIELIFVIVLLGIFTCMAAPALFSIVQQQQLRGEARFFTSSLRGLQQKALTTEATAVMLFSPPSSYTVQEKIHQLSADINYQVLPAGTAQVSYSSLGAPTPAPLTIQFFDQEGRTVEVTLTVTGRVKSSNP